MSNLQIFYILFMQYAQFEIFNLHILYMKMRVFSIFVHKWTLSPFAFHSFHRKRDAFFGNVDAKHAHADDIAHRHHVARVLDEFIGKLGDVHEAVLVNANVNEGAEVDHVSDSSRKDLSLL